MDSTTAYVLGYWALAGFASAGLFANLYEAHLSQRPDAGLKTPIARIALAFVFGGSLLPMVFLITGAVNTAALAAAFFERKNQTNVPPTTESAGA